MTFTKDQRAYVSGRFAVDIGGNHAGWVYHAEGGNPSADVVVEKLGPDHLGRKHVAGVKYDDITVSCGTGMSRQFYSWIQDSFQHKYSRKSGAIIAANFDFQEMTRLSFFEALITEVGLPALDASSKDAAKMTVKFSPEYTRLQRTLSGGPKIGGKFDPGVQKRWLPSNFRLDIKGLEGACRRVSKVDAIVIKQKNIENPIGRLREYEREPASVEFPNLVISVPESHADSFYEWMEDFVVKGNSGAENEKSGTLEYLAPNLKDVLIGLTFHNLGIVKLTPDKVESGSEAIRRVKVEMYCENIELDYKCAFA